MTPPSPSRRLAACRQQLLVGSRDPAEQADLVAIEEPLDDQIAVSLELLALGRSARRGSLFPWESRPTSWGRSSGKEIELPPVRWISLTY